MFVYLQRFPVKDVVAPSFTFPQMDFAMFPRDMARRRENVRIGICVATADGLFENVLSDFLFSIKCPFVLFCSFHDGHET